MRYIRKITLMGAALVAASAIIIIGGIWVAPAAAAVNDATITTKIALMTKEISQGENTNIAVSAQLSDGSHPLGNEPVEFDIAANFFGDRQVNLGTAPTDATGTATLVYQPSWDGAQVITAHFKGDGPHAQADITKTINFSGPVPQYAPEPVGLAPVRQWVTPVVGIGIVIFWTILLFVGLRTLLGIYRSRNKRLSSPRYIPLQGDQVSETFYQHKDFGNKV